MIRKALITLLKIYLFSSSRSIHIFLYLNNLIQLFVNQYLKIKNKFSYYDYEKIFFLLFIFSFFL